MYIEPKSGAEIIVIERASETVTLEKNAGQIPQTAGQKDFCGLLGSIRLLAGSYLVIATHREPAGFIAGHAVWQLAGTQLIPYFRSTLHLSPEELKDNFDYVNMIELVLKTPNFYFSYTYDITHTLQRLHTITPDFLIQSLLERADPRFVWNSYLLNNFRSPEFRNFALPIMHGFLSINLCLINGCYFTWAIISRRSISRAGTRLFRRGIDRDGNVANFVETEQIVEYQGDRASFVQIRGSIPLSWQQLPDLRYKPPPTLHDIAREEQNALCLKHFEQCAMLYGRQVILNLVDQRGAEGRLEKAFQETVDQIEFPSVRYEAFDFHAECRKMRWDRLSILIDRIALDQDEMGYFMLLRDGTLSSLQEGVFRTNCIDCLDRTNVVQSMLAHRSLEAILRKLGILKYEQKLETHAAFESLYKSVWADNADYVSVQYSGTGALKTDFTRTGKRTRMGLVKDGVNSLTRYYKNNFGDGFRQDAIDLFLGNVQPRSPLQIERGWKYVTFPSVLLVAVAMFVICAVFPAEYSTENLLYLLFWGLMVGATGSTIFKHGPEFVDRPRLGQ